MEKVHLINSMHKIERPIFVFGCNNSGTTVLWKTLKGHPDLCGPDVESQTLPGLPKHMTSYIRETFRLFAHPKFKMCYHVTENDYREEDHLQIARVFSSFLTPNKRLVFKSPSDTLRARLIQSYFPDASFVAIVRNGYAVCEGTVRKRRDDPERPQYTGMFTTYEEAAEQWFRANVMVVSNASFLKRYKIIKYEDLVAQPKATLERLTSFCDIDLERLPIPELKDDLNFKQIRALAPYQIESITCIAHPMLEHFEYEVLRKSLHWYRGRTASGQYI
ncbi:MAG: sulfotransferase [Nanoarchaeota archaeon]